MAAAPIFNPHPQIERVALANGQHCLVIDDAVTEPERFVAFAAAQGTAFRDVDFNAYPGTYLMSPADVAAALREFFVQHLRRHFDARRVLDMHCRFSMVTRRPEELRPPQWFCHRDNLSGPPDQSIQASVLYLFRDPGLGGTSFYEALRPPAEIDALNRDAFMLDADAFARKWGLAQGYMTGSNHLFRRIGSVAARWNRLIFYDGSILHSGDIVAPERLGTDPERGRLTFNSFFTCRRHAA